MLITMTIMKCSVCDEGIFTHRSAWLRHLLSEGHQSLARKELLSWGEAEKDCALVLFGKLPVGEDDKVIQYLSNSKHKDIFVTDFVWWPERPRVAFVQFKDKDSVKWIVSSFLARRQFRIDPGDQFCQVKEGWTIPELEWTVLLPEGVMMTPTKPDDPNEDAPQHSLPDGPDPPEVSEATLKLNVISQVVVISPVAPPVHAAGSSASVSQKLGLRDHLLSIRKRIEIPDEEYKMALDILSGIQERSHSSPNSTLQFTATLNRHWNLKLRYSLKPKQERNTKLSIILYTKVDLGSLESRAITMTQLKDIDKQLLRPGQGRRNFLSFEVLRAEVDQVDNKNRWGVIHYDLKNPSGGEPFKFCIATNPFFVEEIRIWQLIKYLCTFDPRCSPVLAVLYYWARVNSVLVGSSSGPSSVLPDPSGLNWLLMMFFQQEGLIPSVKRVLEQPHEPQLRRGVDIGFCEDPNSKLRTEWMSGRRTGTGVENPDQNQDLVDENFAQEVFKLLSRFFLFCSSKLGGGGGGQGQGWLLNTRDGEILPLEEFMSVGTPKHSRLTHFEQACTIRMIKEEKLLENPGGPNTLVMLHPLVIKWRISTSNSRQAFAAMKETEMKLGNYLDHQRQCQNGKLELKEFLEVLKVQKS